MNQPWGALKWLENLNNNTLRQDLLAGLTGAFVVLPQGVAFAAIAGLPPQYGLYTAMVPAIIAALFGSSHHLISGPTTAISIVVFATLAPLAEPGGQQFIVMALTLAFLAGIFQLALGLARLGALVNFVSHSVVVGFTGGAAILIATSQLKHLFGLTLPNGESFLHTWVDLIHLLPNMNLFAFSIGMATLMTAILAKRFFPKWPNMLAAMLVGSVLAHVFNGAEHALALVGPLPGRLPPLSFPDLSWTTLRELSSGALAIALLGLIEAVSISRSVAIQSGQTIEGNQEFIGQGVANIVGCFFSAYPSSGSFTRTGVNYRAGAKTPLSAVFSAFFLMGIVLVVAPLAAHLPIAVMAGIILRVAFDLINVQHIRKIIKSTRPGTLVLSVTFLSTLLLELEFAIYAGVLLSLALYLKRTSHPRVTSRVPDLTSPWRSFITDKNLPECPQLKIIRIDGSLYFGSVSHVKNIMRRMRIKRPDQKNLLVVCSGINFIDLSGADMLLYAVQQQQARGGHLFLYDVKEQVSGMFRQNGYINIIGRDHLFYSKREALQTIVSDFLDQEQCLHCPHHVFLECPNQKKAAEREADALGKGPGRLIMG